MLNVGWLEDGLGVGRNYVGGAELTADELRLGVPGGVKIHPVPADADGAPGVDVWVVQNCTTYRFKDWVGVLATAPVVKYVHDVWPHGDTALRGWILQHAARLVFCSPAHYHEFPLPFQAAASVVLPPVDVAWFRAASAAAARIGVVRYPNRALYVGHNRKGLAESQRLAERKGLTLDAYGVGTDNGPVPFADVPGLMARYRYFAYTPTTFEPFGRTIVEARAAGCEILTDAPDRIGCLDIIDHVPKPSVSTEQFWRIVADEAARWNNR